MNADASSPDRPKRIESVTSKPTGRNFDSMYEEGSFLLFNEFLKVYLERVEPTLTISWPIDVKQEIPPPYTVIARIAALEEGQRRQEFFVKHAIQPAIQGITRKLESSPQITESPPASSARYELNSKLTELLETLTNLMDQFEDLGVRLYLYTALQRQLRGLLKYPRVRSARFLRSAILTLHDATYSIYSEDLTLDHVQTLCDWVTQIRTTVVGRDHVRKLGKALRDVGFETIPTEKFEYVRNA